MSRSAWQSVANGHGRVSGTHTLRESPIRFAVFNREGLSSNAWGVYSGKLGDIYIRCRDHMKEQKISLHQSGRQHIAFTSESGIETTEGSRFWDQWWEPQSHDRSKVVPTFSLFFPSWGLSLTQSMRDDNPRVWNKNQIRIGAAENPEATVVSFAITDDDFEMRHNDVEHSWSSPLGALPTRPGSKLWVIAYHRPEGNMKELTEPAIRELQASRVDQLREFPSGHVFGMCVSGLTEDGGAFIMPFTVQVEWTGT